MATDMRIARLGIAARPGVSGGLVTARALIEDAMRTESAAAGPSAARGLLVVRRINAGRIGASADRSALQRRVGDALAAAGRYAHRPLGPGARSADAVIFHDLLEAYALYSEALFHHSNLCDAWFFRAVFGRQNGATTVETGRMLLLRAAEERFAPFAVAEVVMRAGPLASLLVTSLTAIKATEILERIVSGESIELLPSKALPVMRAATERPEPHHPAPLRNVSPVLQTAIAGTARRLGIDDPRSLLLVAVVMIHASATPVSLRAVMAAARAILQEAIIATQQESRTSVLPAPPLLAGPRERPSPSALADVAPVTREMRAIKLPLEMTQNGFGNAAAEPAEPRGPSSGPPSPGPERSGQHPETSHRHSDLTSANLSKTAHDAEPTGLPPANREPNLGSTKHDGPEEPAVQSADDPHPPAMMPWGAPSAWAGGVLLVSAVHRLLLPLVGMTDALDECLGRILLDRVLRRAGCGEHDPTRRAFARLSPEPAVAGPFPFYLLAAFALFGAPDLTLHSIRDYPGWRALTCRRARVVLAIWRGRAPPTVRDKVDGAALRRGDALTRNLIPAILTTAELMLRKWIRQATGYRIGQLVGRSGWVRATRSHIDVTFDTRLVDLAVRRAGLDLDPGWCPWLFRVVAIHYDFGARDA